MTTLEEQVSKVFVGSVMLPGDQGPGLEASVEMGEGDVRMYTGDEELGMWGESDFDVSPSGKGSFRLNLGGEMVYFTPSSPSSFAEAMEVPLQAEEPTDKPKYDIDEAIDEAIANVKPLKSIHDEDDILSKPLLTGIVVISGGLMAGIAGMAFML